MRSSHLRWKTLNRCIRRARTLQGKPFLWNVTATAWAVWILFAANLATAADPPLPAGSGRAAPDAAKLAASGIRRLSGKHLTLYTDVGPSAAVDELPAIFDQAVPQWCRYFDIPSAKAEDWRMTGYLIKEKASFQAAGLFGDNLPPFLHGYQREHELWLYEQPSAYYRRHLLLHEGTHAFMYWYTAGSGPPWYSEGTAELMATHRYQEGKITLRYFPRNREEVDLWGRIKIVRDEYAANRGMGLPEILAYDRKAHLKNEPYGWCWAAAAFLDAHPLSSKDFRAMKDLGRDSSHVFNDQFITRITPYERELLEDWQLFVVNVEYGYDIQRAAIVRKKAAALGAAGGEFSLQVDRGWQSSGFRLEEGKKYRIAAAGRYRLAEKPDVIESEPQGVTIHYYRSLPWGAVVAAVSDDDAPLPSLTPLARPGLIGPERTITPKSSGTLYLKINESAADLADNRGQVKITVTRAEP